MNSQGGVARIVLIADDPDGALPYRNALADGGYEVLQAAHFVDALESPMADPDVIVLCDLAMFAYPSQNAQVLSVPAGMTPAALIVEVHRRVALRAALQATIARAA
jgi:hypothetical protein